MKTLFSAFGSKKLMVVGSVLALVIQDAVSRGWTSAHLFSVAIMVGCYCLGQGLVDMGSELYDGTPSSDPGDTK